MRTNPYRGVSEPFRVCGVIVGFDVQPRTDAKDGTSSPLVQLLIEDDGQWIRKDVVIDAFWLDDLIGTAQTLRAALAIRTKR